MDSKKVLIIKTGWTETLTDEAYKEGEVSLGDVLRSTALLHLYKKCHVTWLTDGKAVPLLANNPYIDRVLEFNLTTLMQIIHEPYDVVVNLEKNPGMCAVVFAMTAWQKYGFRFDQKTGEAEAFKGSTEALYLSRDAAMKNEDPRHWLQHLYKMVGEEWRSERYVLEPPVSQPYQHMIVALNWKTGNKFAQKEWPWERWNELHKRLERQGISARYQNDMLCDPGTDMLEDYKSFINSHTLIVSCDSLGLHIGMAYNKRVVGLFGPTPAKEMPPYEHGTFIQKDTMEDITVDEVEGAVLELLSWGEG